MPHENQQVCLEALAAEIARLRSVLEHSASAAVPGAPTPENDEPDET
jgi:hypothetical protein